MFFYSLLTRTFYSTHQQGLSLLSVAIKTASVIHGLGAACLMREMCSADQFSFSCAGPACSSVYASVQMSDIERRNVFLVKPIYSGITEGLSPTPGAPSFSLSVILSVLKNVSGLSLSAAASICSGVCCRRERGVRIVQSRRRGRVSSST